MAASTEQRTRGGRPRRTAEGKRHPFRLLTAFGLLLVVIFGLVFFTGTREATPKLGIDLQGGTRVTLTARTPDGNEPSRESLTQAQQIIETRVNAMGVSGSEVLIDGSNLVITVPGDDSSQARSLGQTARLYIRPVLGSIPTEGRDQMAGGTTDPAAGDPNAVDPNAVDPNAVDPNAVDPNAVDPNAVDPNAATEAPAETAPQNRPFPAQDQPDTDATETPAEDAPADGAATPTDAATGDAAQGDAAQDGEPTTEAERAAQEINDAKALRQSDDQMMQQIAALGLDCNAPDPLQGNDDPTLPLVTCDTEGANIYLLGPSIIDGQDIADATSGFNNQQSRYEVSLTYDSEASNTWAEFTAGNIGSQAAFVLDSKVVSAPVIEGVTPAGSPTSITGNFTPTQASELAQTLKYGSLPLSFTSSEAETVSATLGLAALKAGLIAGAVGLVLVLAYCLFYYRLLGLLTAFSLVLSGLAVYGILVLLGRWIGYTLDLAGIAGLVIGIGMTADSFVVFFERIKDELREGRSFRSAVPRGWVRARRTILSGNMVSFIAAAVLYFLAIGQVRGFAFTLGLTTILDVVVVFLVTWPLVDLASRSAFWARPAANGQGAVMRIARERKQAAERQAATVGAAE